MTTPSFVRTEVVDGVHHVQLDRPERLNAVSDELYADLEPALQAVADADDARVLLLSGAGRAFCAGADLKAHATRDRTPAERRAYVWAGQRVGRLLQTMQVPVVTAVHGHAIGAGAEMALSGDVIVCAEDLRIAFPEVGLGTFVGGGLTQRLPLLVGPARARELLLLDRRLTGAEAVEWGLATEAVEAEHVLDRAWALARYLAEQPAISVRFAKQALSRAGSLSLDEALVLEAEALLACMGTDDWSSGVEAFDARREQGGE
jgi:enoyl-CoA hydratase/carnithine racemase